MIFVGAFKVFNRLKRKLIHVRQKPIRVFVFHQVSDTFDSSNMWACDWTETGQFKENILNLKKQYYFIPLCEAYDHIENDLFRFKRYAVLTCDDGWLSIKNIIHWLAEEKIYVTLFLNSSYLSGEQIRENNMSGLLKIQDVKELLDECSPFVSIGSHGWNHDNCLELNLDEFTKNVMDNDNYLSQFNSSYIRYFAYPCGHHTKKQDDVLINMGVIPVYCDGLNNYDESNCIHRICIDGKI